MGFFGRKNRGPEEGPRQASTPGQDAAGARVRILGSGCAKCNALEAAAREALARLGLDTDIEHVTDFAQIAACGVMATPALVVDGKVLSAGRVLSVREIVALLSPAK